MASLYSIPHLTPALTFPLSWWFLNLLEIDVDASFSTKHPAVTFSSTL